MDWFATAEAWVKIILSIVGLGSTALLGICVYFYKKMRESNKQNAQLKDKLTTSVVEGTSWKRSYEASQHELMIVKNNLPIAPKVKALLDDYETRLASVRSICSGDNEKFWSRPIEARINDYENRLFNSIPVLLFANQKGGVGKTTLSTNLAAYFSEHGEKVLVIDVDYQGSATAVMIAQSGTVPDSFPSRIKLLLNSELSDEWPLAIETVTNNLHYVSAGRSFEPFERCLEHSWVIGDEPDDIRYRLARIIHSDHVQKTYDRVIIDAPPRLTVGFINGFCAATHLFAPMQVNFIATDAMINFVRTFNKLRSVNPVLKFAGIIGTMTTAGPDLPGTVQSVATNAETRVQEQLDNGGTYIMQNAVIKQSVALARPISSGIPYLQDDVAKTIFDPLGAEISKRAPRRVKQ